ncbi:DUF982 domain-containing protein [Rhizobium sp. S152]|uniref:DUF982 domain-containing protein n=1 Tax=Rhizobium sp. S152 TaxID=3055038 RepID=UPI003FA7331E
MPAHGYAVKPSKGARKMFVSSPVKIKHLSVRFDGSHRWHDAATIVELTELLLSSRWPKRPNDTVWRDALVACLGCQQNETKAGKARKAFVKAARQAELDLEPEGRVH